jgi:hypothetical protein
MSFQDKRLWYIVIAVVIVLIIAYAMWPIGETTPPPATTPPATTPPAATQ